MTSQASSQFNSPAGALASSSAGSVAGPQAASVQALNIALAYGKTQVLRDVSLSVQPGEFFALLGPSGSGKSTLLRLIAGFNQHQSGQLLIDGNDVSGVPPWKRNVGMVFQNYALWPHMTVAQNVAFGLEERRLPRAQIKQRVEQALQMVDLTEYGARRPGQLSGGQQQRVAIARTLAIEPRVLLLDEPLSNLDARLRVQTRQELVKLQRRLGITTLFVTHDQEEALTTCHRIAVMDQGVIQQIGTPQQLFDEPANRFVAQFVGSANLFSGRLRRDAQALWFDSDALGSIRLPAAVAGLEQVREQADLIFRPHGVRLDDNSAQPAIQLAGTVLSSEFLGEFQRYEAQVGQARVLVDLPHERGVAPMLPGAGIRLRVPDHELRLIAA